MKINALLVALLASASSTYLSAADNVVDPFTQSERGPHHTVWSRSSEEQLPNGHKRKLTHSYTELASGLNYWSEEQQAWVPSSDQIEIVNGFGVARQGQLKVIWAPNLNTAGAVDAESADDKRFRSHLLGLAFTDTKTGASFFIATVKDSIGQVSANQVIYRDAFEGISADVVYTYTPAGLEQDIILKENLPDPSQPPWNLDPSTILLENYTEFIEAPAPEITSAIFKQEANPALRALMAEPDLVDQCLDFGATTIGAGMAYPPNGSPRIPVMKSFEKREQRQFLIEKVEYPTIKMHLAELPKAAAFTPDRMKQIRQNAVREAKGVIRSPIPAVPPLLAKAKAVEKPMRMASVPQNNAAGVLLARRESRPGFTLDYVELNTASSITLACDRTYYISGIITLSGTNYLEGGTVIKFAPTNSPTLNVYGRLICQTSPYRMAVLTARDDHSIGEQIGTNVLSGYYASAALALNAQISGSSFDIEYVRVLYAKKALDFYMGANNVVAHSQIVSCGTGYSAFENPNLSFRNVLFSSVTNACSGGGVGSTGRWEHVTLDNVQWLNQPGDCTLFLTNTLLANVTNSSSYSGSGNSTQTGSSIFQTVGEGAHYLASGSTLRNAGTTTINSTLASELKRKTTYPPIVMANQWVTMNTTLSPQAQRDTDTPDIGYHYDPLDYAIGTALLSNATLTVNAGTAVGIFSTNQNYGIGFYSGGNLFSEGSPTNLNRFVAFNTVQEHANTNWGRVCPYALTLGWAPISPKPQARFRFSDFSCLAQDTYHIYSYQDTTDYPFPFTDCQFHGGAYYVSLKPFLYVTNSLFERVGGAIDDGGSVVMTNIFRNCLFHGGSLAFYENFGSPWLFRDNFFNNLDSFDPEGSFDGDYNAYNTTNSTRVATGAHDVILGTTNVTFDTGALGRFYLKTNSTLIDAGSFTNASLIGMYHYTTLTNNSKELTNRLDISFHYVAVTNGVPFDTDGDGVPDYQEDSNGNGLVDSGETDWQSASDLGLRVIITRPVKNSILP